jgi:hypothetical protein
MRTAPPRAAIALACAAAGAGFALLGSTIGHAQAIQTSRPRDLVVGVPDGARTDRVDGSRSGLARVLMPSSHLRVEWRAPTRTAIEQGPLVDARGATYVVGTRGEVIAIARSGAELWRASTGGIDAGPAALLSDDTVVFVDGAGEAIAVRDGNVQWRTRIGRPASDGAAFPSPLPLEDGGVIVATGRELAVLDAEGHERARTTFAEPVATSLVSALGRVVAVARSGAVFTWVPGAPEPARVAAFGSPVAGGAALADAHTLVAVVASGTTFASVDLLSGAVATRAVATAGLWLGPPAMRAGAATLASLGVTSETAVTLAASGREVGRAVLSTHPPAARLDGGAPPPDALQPTSAFLVDPAGTLVFVTLSGDAGAVAGAGGAGATVELLSDTCARAGGAPGVVAGGVPATSAAAGIAPLGPGAFVVACRSGAVVGVSGELGGAEPRAGEGGGGTTGGRVPTTTSGKSAASNL